MASPLPPQQLSLSVQLDDSATFDNFFIKEGSNNLQAIDVCQSIAENAESCSLVYLWGSKGAGRSHLLQALCHRSSAASIYLPLHEFVTENPLEVLADIEQMPIVVLDDLDQVSQNPGWSEQLFHLYNRIQDRQGVLIVSADAPPALIETPLADLKSRLSAMQIYRLDALADDQKESALILRARNRGMEMPEVVASYLLSHYSRDMSDQLGFLELLDQGTLSAQRKLTVPFVKQLLQQSNQQRDRP